MARGACPLRGAAQSESLEEEGQVKEAAAQHVGEVWGGWFCCVAPAFVITR